MAWEYSQSDEQSSVPAGWTAYDAAEDRWPGKFFGFRRVVSGLVCRIEPGDHSSFIADGFQWRVESDRSSSEPEASAPWRRTYDDEGHADTVDAAVADVAGSVAFVTSGRAAVDYYAQLASVFHRGDDAVDLAA